MRRRSASRPENRGRSYGSRKIRLSRLRTANRFTKVYVQVLAAIVIGVALDTLSATRRADEAAGRRVHQDEQLDHRSNLLRTVVHGISSMQDMKKVGRSLKALIYFEVTPTIALVVGLIVVNLLQPALV